MAFFSQLEFRNIYFIWFLNAACLFNERSIQDEIKTGIEVRFIYHFRWAGWNFIRPIMSFNLRSTLKIVSIRIFKENGRWFCMSTSTKSRLIQMIVRLIWNTKVIFGDSNIIKKKSRHLLLFYLDFYLFFLWQKISFYFLNYLLLLFMKNFLEFQHTQSFW